MAVRSTQLWEFLVNLRHILVASSVISIDLGQLFVLGQMIMDFDIVPREVSRLDVGAKLEQLVISLEDELLSPEESLTLGVFNPRG